MRTLNCKCYQTTCSLTDGWLQCDDLIEFCDNNQFRILGRSDDVIKIEERRISLKEIANAISGLSPQISTTHVVSYQKNARQRLAALVVTNDEHIANCPDSFAESLSVQLRTMIDPIFIPKAWKVTARFEASEMGKISSERVLKEVFEGV
jgi:acyl-coenzyme A synthetase/AMP-(fatty) acid ligase